MLKSINWVCCSLETGPYRLQLILCTEQPVHFVLPVRSCNLLTAVGNRGNLLLAAVRRKAVN